MPTRLKNLLWILSAILIPSVLIAWTVFVLPAQSITTPRYLGFEGQLTDSSDNLLTGTYDITFRIYNSLTGGTALWTEIQSNVSVSNGFFSVNLGDTTALTLDFDYQYWISVEVESDGEMSPRTPINSVGYAYTSDVAFGAYSTTTAPGSAAGGDLYYDTDDNNIYLYNGTSWEDLTTIGSSASTTQFTVSDYLWIGDDNTDSVEFIADVASNITPDGNDTRDFGAFGSAWNNLFASSTSYLDYVSSTAMDLGSLTLTSALSPSGNNTVDFGSYGSAWQNIFASSTAYLDYVTSTAIQVGSEGTSGAYLDVYEGSGDTTPMIYFGPTSTEFSSNVQTNYLNISNSVIGFKNNLEAGAGVYSGLTVLAENDVVTDTVGLQAMVVSAVSSHASGNKTLLLSEFNQPRHDGAGTLSGMTGLSIYPLSTSGSGTVTDVKALHVSPNLEGTTTNLYRLKVEEGSSDGTITNSYGLYIDEMNGNGDVLNYSIYSNGPSDGSAPFVVEGGGNVGLGTATPTALFEMLGGNFNIGSGSVTTTLSQTGTASFGGSVTPVSNDALNLGAFGSAWQNIYASSTAYLDYVSSTAITAGLVDYSVAEDLGEYVSSDSDNTIQFYAGGSEVLEIGSTLIGANQGIRLNDALSMRFGSSNDSTIRYSTAQSADALILGLSTDSNSFLISETGDAATDFSHAVQTNPTIFVHSADATNINQYLSFAHDQTNGVIGVGTGNLTVSSTALVGSANGTSNNGADLGAYDSAWKNIYASTTLYIGGSATTPVIASRSDRGQVVQFEDGTDVVGIHTSDGSPESAIAADRGSVAIDTTNGALYVKTTDSANTGWDLLDTTSSTLDQLAIIADQKAAGTSGGASSVGINTRDLNTEIYDPDGIVSISSNQFTLQAGTYEITANVPAQRTDRTKAFLYNVTDASYDIIGDSAFSDNSGSYAATHSFVNGVITISSAKTYEIRQYVTDAFSPRGFGVETDDGQVEVYTTVKIRKFQNAGTTTPSTRIQDADNDTYIELETTTDDDTLRFWSGGTEVLSVTSTGLLAETNNTFNLGAWGSSWNNLFASSTAYLDYVSSTAMDLSSLTVSGSLLPSGNSTISLGEFDSAWKNIYASSTAYLDYVTSTKITVTGGSAAAPGISGTDSDTGVHFGDNSLILSVGGGQQLGFSTVLTTSNNTIVPSSADSYDLGSFSLPWQSLYASSTAYLDFVSSTMIDIGSGTASGAQMGTAGDLFVSDDLEVDGRIYVDSDALFGDNDALKFGGAQDSWLYHNTTQTEDSLFLGVGAESDALVFAQQGDRTFDFSHPDQNNPTIFVHSANQDTHEYISISHDQTNAVIGTGAGNLVASSTAFVGSANGTSNNGADLGAWDSAWQNIYASSTAHLDYVSSTVFNASGGSTSFPAYGNGGDDGMFFTSNQPAIVQAGNYSFIFGINSNISYDDITPVSNNGFDLGAFGTAWRDVYASSTVYTDELTFVNSVSSTDPNGAAILSSPFVSATNPTILPNNTDFTTGISNVGETQGSGLFLVVSTTEAVTLFRNGASDVHVGVGTTTPWTDFAVDGDVSFDGLTLNTGGGNYSLCLDANTNEVLYNTDNETCLASSERFKKNIYDLDLSMEELLEMRAVEFEYKESQDGKVRYGLIAEEVKEIDERLVSYDGEGLPNGIRWSHITTVIINAIQEMWDTVSGNSDRLDTLESAVSALVLDGSADNINTEGIESQLSGLLVEFEGDILVNGHAIFNGDTVGLASIQADYDGVMVEFETEYEREPVVTITPQNHIEGTYWLSEVRKDRFVIELSESQDENVVFSWHAFGVVPDDTEEVEEDEETDPSTDTQDEEESVEEQEEQTNEEEATEEEENTEEEVVDDGSDDNGVGEESEENVEEVESEDETPTEVGEEQTNEEEATEEEENTEEEVVDEEVEEGGNNGVEEEQQEEESAGEGQETEENNTEETP